VFFDRKTNRTKYYGKKIGNGNTFTARAFFNKKKKRCEKSSSIYKSRKKMKQKQEFKKKQGSNWSFHLELSQKTEKTMRHKRKKLRGCPLVRVA